MKTRTNTVRTESVMTESVGTSYYKLCVEPLVSEVLL